VSGCIGIAVILLTVLLGLDRPAHFSRFGLGGQPWHRIFEPFTAPAFLVDHHIWPVPPSDDPAVGAKRSRHDAVAAGGAGAGAGGGGVGEVEAAGAARGKKPRREG
jgi:hypothetical protein